MAQSGQTASKWSIRSLWKETLAWLQASITRRDVEPLAIALIVCILTLVWVYYGKQNSFYKYLGAATAGLQHQDFWSALYEYSTAFVLMLVIPAVIGRLAFGKSPRDYGLQWGDTRRGLRLLAIGIPAMLMTAWVSSMTPMIQAEYPAARSMLDQAPLFVAMEAFYVLYYVGWEYLFRGFLLLGMQERYGPIAAIVIQTLPSALAHIGKPASEAFAAIAAGLVFGFVAVRTQSTLYPTVLHSVLGISLDLALITQMSR